MPFIVFVVITPSSLLPATIVRVTNHAIHIHHDAHKRGHKPIQTAAIDAAELLCANDTRHTNTNIFQSQSPRLTASPLHRSVTGHQILAAEKHRQAVLALSKRAYQTRRSVLRVIVCERLFQKGGEMFRKSHHPMFSGQLRRNFRGKSAMRQRRVVPK